MKIMTLVAFFVAIFLQVEAHAQTARAPEEIIADVNQLAVQAQEVDTPEDQQELNQKVAALVTEFANLLPDSADSNDQ